MLNNIHKAAVAAALLLAACATPGPAPPGPGNPLFDGADPAALGINGVLWIYPTGETERLLAWSNAANGWAPRGVLLRQSEIEWIDDDGARRHHLWAPHVVRAKGRYYLYYSVGPQNPTPSRLGVAVGSRPEGPFVDSGRPLLTGDEHFEPIDPMVFRDPKTGHHYLYVGGSAGARLRVFVLADDMIRIEREIAVAQPPRFTEASYMHERAGVYYLSYSHGRWNTGEYSVHYATAAAPTGPWRYRGAILTGNARYKGPGHHGFVPDPATGNDLIVYHRWEGQRGRGPYRGKRSVAIERVSYAPDGSIEPIQMTGRSAP